MRNYYEILGIKKNVSQQEIKKAYFVMAKKYHPDSGDAAEVKKFHEVAEAYKILSDPDSRKAYDTTLVAKGDVEVKKIVEIPKHQTTHDQKRESYRDIELKEFYKNRFRKALFRVIGFTFLIGFVGFVANLIFGGISWLGFIAGLLVGFGISIHRNFDVNSFFHSKKMSKNFRILTWLLLALGVGYFVFLISSQVF